MSKEDRLVQTAKQLTEATEQGKIVWHTMNTPTAFQFVRTKSSARIRSVEGDGSPPYEFVILDGEGVAVESLRSEWDFDGEAQSWNPVLEDLYEAARRQALNIDEILNDLTDFDEGGF